VAAFDRGKEGRARGPACEFRSPANEPGDRNRWIQRFQATVSVADRRPPGGEIRFQATDIDAFHPMKSAGRDAPGRAIHGADRQSANSAGKNLDMLRRLLVNYLARHQNRTNQLLHLVGLPVTFLPPLVLLANSRPQEALYCFIAGYALQFVGHWFEGNDAGEMILLKKWLGRPYIEFGRASKLSKPDG
jgi:hypothetical protein